MVISKISFAMIRTACHIFQMYFSTTVDLFSIFGLISAVSIEIITYMLSKLKYLKNYR